LRVAVVLTYPLYHASPVMTVKKWLEQPDRERMAAALIAQMGHQVELWAVGEIADEINEKDYKIRIFKPNKKRKKSKYHFSEALVAHARQLAADLHILKGVDGGVGTFLLKNYLEPYKRWFGFIIGGEYHSTYVPRAEIVFYETQKQKQILQSPGWRRWRKKIPRENLVRMPKFIDTRVFCPMDQKPKKWDILVVGRLIPGYKNYDVLGLLSGQFRVAMAGDGPKAAQLRALYPKVDWLGYIPNLQLPQYYNRSHLFMHTGFRDFYPRVIAEAMACGLPCIAFDRTIAREVLPSGCGLLVPHRIFIPPILELLKDKKRLQKMGQQARLHALKHMGKDACQKALEEMFLRLDERQITAEG
jgi:glycosyltransferase involved in cell wall biosynthesis